VRGPASIKRIGGRESRRTQRRKGRHQESRVLTRFFSSFAPLRLCVRLVFRVHPRQGHAIPAVDASAGDGRLRHVALIGRTMGRPLRGLRVASRRISSDEPVGSRAHCGCMSHWLHRNRTNRSSRAIGFPRHASRAKGYVCQQPKTDRPWAAGLPSSVRLPAAPVCT